MPQSKLAGFSLAAAFITFMPANAVAAHLNDDCEAKISFDNSVFEYVRSASMPKVMNTQQQLYLTLYDVFLSEPVGAPAFVAIVVESHDGRDCYLLENAAAPDGALGGGFGDTMAEHSFAYFNEEKNHTQLFVPVRDYTYAEGPENYVPRFVEILISGDDALSLSVVD